MLLMGADIGSSAGGAGALLRGWRERALLTQKQLAARAGLNARTIRRLESDDSIRPQGTTLRLLVDALNLSAAEQETLAAAARGTITEPSGDDVGFPDPKPPSEAVPRQLPAPPARFTGRAAELAELDRVHDRTAVVITVIDGMAGIGKTALAVHAAHRMARHYPGGQLFMDLHGHTEGMRPVEPGEALERLLRALGVPGAQIPQRLDDRAALYRSRLADRSMLILLDNAASEAQILPLLPGMPGCQVLITSRLRFAGLDHTHSVSLDLLPLHDAVSLFTQTVGEKRLAGEPPEVVADVVELCGRLPLAIRIAAARTQSRPSWGMADLSERLRDHQHRLSELGAGQRNINAALDLSYHHLSPKQQLAYRMLGLHPGSEIDTHAAAALVDDALTGTGQAIDGLLEANLLQEPSPGRYRFHDLLRAHAAATAERDGTEPELRAAIARLHDHYACAASIASAVAYPYDRERRPDPRPSTTPIPDLSDPAAATAWLDIELPNLLATARHAADIGRPDHAMHLSAFLRRHLRVCGRYTDAETLHSMALAAANGIGNRVGELRALTDLGEARRLQGRHELAVSDLKRALEIARAIDDGSSEALVLRDLGVLHSHQGRNELAAEHFLRALAISREFGDRSRELEVLNSLGYARLKEGRYETGVEHLTQAQQIARDTGNPHAELSALTGLAWFHRYQRRREDAIEAFEQALALARAIGNRNGQLGAMIGLGWARRVEGRHAEAANLYQQMLELAEDVGSRNYQLEAWQGMGRLQHDAGRPDRAILSHRKALELAGELNQTSDEARAHDGLAHAYRALHDHDNARHHWKRALDNLTRLGIDHAEDEETTVTAIRAHLENLDRSQQMPDCFLGPATQVHQPGRPRRPH
ncbi:tetratricopeptide repeat protein [Actinomycetes bacterium KLBMP 9759]